MIDKKEEEDDEKKNNKTIVNIFIVRVNIKEIKKKKN